MKYVTGIYALNRKCDLDTPGDWHYSSIDWSNVPLSESDNHILSNYGIETVHNINYPINGSCDYYIANHIRACLDIAISGELSELHGIEVFLYDENNPESSIEFMETLIFIKSLIAKERWYKLDKLMTHEFGSKWNSLIKIKESEVNQNSEYC